MVVFLGRGEDYPARHQGLKPIFRMSFLVDGSHPHGRVTSCNGRAWVLPDAGFGYGRGFANGNKLLKMARFLMLVARRWRFRPS